MQHAARLRDSMPIHIPIHRACYTFDMFDPIQESQRMKVLAIVPAYNEEACLRDTIEHLSNVCPDIDYLIVDDGSKDRTSDIMERYGLHGASLPINTGLTSAFRLGMKYALRHGYDAAVQFDADGQHLPEYIAPMARALREHDANIVIASRFLDGSSKPQGLRGAGQRLITALIKLTTGHSIADPTGGMRMYNRRMIELFATSFDAAPEPDMVAYIARVYGKVVEIPAKMRERQGGTSYFHVLNVLKYMSRTCISIVMMRFLP